VSGEKDQPRAPPFHVSGTVTKGNERGGEGRFVFGNCRKEKGGKFQSAFLRIGCTDKQRKKKASIFRTTFRKRGQEEKNQKNGREKKGRGFSWAKWDGMLKKDFLFYT